MRRWWSAAAWAACGLWRGLRRVRPAGPALRVLLYHSVGGAVPGDRLALYSLDAASFRVHMEMLAVSARVRPLSDTHAGGDGVAITFDDGFRDSLTVAAPILIGLGLPFTVFATTAFVQSGDPPYMSPAQLRELAALPGACVGAHGATHARLTECDDRTLRRELVGSRHYLEDLLQQPVTAMSYPHGRVDTRVRAAVAEAGYTLAACSRFGTNTPTRDRLQLRRIDIWSSDAPHRFSGKVRGDWDWMGWIGR